MNKLDNKVDKLNTNHSKMMRDTESINKRMADLKKKNKESDLVLDVTYQRGASNS